MLARRLIIIILVSAAHACAMTLQPAGCKVDPQRCMGKWFVQRAIPAVKALEKNAHNGVEIYEWDAENERVEVTYTFNARSFEGPQRTVKQRGWIQDESGSRWAVAPEIAGFGLPVKLPFIIIAVDDTNYSYMTCTGGLNSWLYIMTRDMKPDPATVQKLEEEVENLGFDMSKVISMPHQDQP
jgi:lipocalin